MRKLAIAAASFVAVLGCWVGTANAEAEPIVFIISYHNLDYADTACRDVLSKEPLASKTIRDGLEADWVKDIVTGAAECRTVRDARELGTRLENELADALAVEPLCAGVTVIRDPHPKFNGGNFSQANYAIKQKKLFWDLHLDYRPGSKVFHWTLFPNDAGMKSSGPPIDGEGNPDKAAKQICTVVTRRGATIR
jgi:hypothetical protein